MYLLMSKTSLEKVVSFYGTISSSTATNGKLIHPQGIKPLKRTNYSTIIKKHMMNIRGRTEEGSG